MVTEVAHSNDSSKVLYQWPRVASQLDCRQSSTYETNCEIPHGVYEVTNRLEGILVNGDGDAHKDHKLRVLL